MVEGSLVHKDILKDYRVLNRRSAFLEKTSLIAEQRQNCLYDHVLDHFLQSVAS